MKELTLDRTLQRQNRGNKVRAVQEWLSLRGFGLVCDGDYGAATEFAVCRFQEEQGLAVTGIVEQDTFDHLVAPMRMVLEEQPPGPDFGATVVSCAARHLEQQPREIGGQNMGPWVRLYMNGNEGTDWPWCAGFACLVLKQACRSMGASMPIQASFSCDWLAASAKDKGRFLSERHLDRADVQPGMLFLNRRTATDWTHVGIVISADPSVFLTIEGNTNDDGSREGYEVCRRIRGYRSKDFIRVD